MQDEKPEESALSRLWDQHMAAEFGTGNIDDVMATMADKPYVTMVPLVVGAIGFDELRQYYSSHFIGQFPADLKMTLISRTVGRDRVVDEMVAEFTHDIVMDWLLPGVAPTGRRIALPFVVIVQGRDGKIAGETVYWDQASVLVQAGLLDPTGLPVSGAESARQVLNPSPPANTLLAGEGAAKTPTGQAT